MIGSSVVSLDDFFLSLQPSFDRAIRRLRLGPARPREGRHGYRPQPMAVGTPTSTPAFQMASLCWWRGKCYLLSREEPGPFDGRADLDLVLQGTRDLRYQDVA